jgi:elongation factor Ts
MSDVEMDEIKELRERTGAGLMDCREALRETNGDMQASVKYLREKGKEVLDEKSGRKTKEGSIGTYTHAEGKGGVIVEVNCETDFVSQNEEFTELVNELCLQIYGMKPSVIERDDLDEDVVNEQKELFEKEAREEGKPDNVIDQIVEGKMEKKFFKEHVLLEQPYFRDDDGEQTVEDMIQEYALKFGENISVRRFERFEVGEDLDNTITASLEEDDSDEDE